MKSREAYKYLAFFIPLFFLVPAIYAALQKPLMLFPWKQRVYKADAYADGDAYPGKTGSTIDSFITGADTITLDYTLRDMETYPYAGLYFATDINHGFIDLSGYDFLKLKMAVSSRDIYQIKIKTHIDGYTIENDSNTRCPLEKALVLENFSKEYIIPLTEFGFLDWWFGQQQLDPADYNAQRLLTKTASINVQQTKEIDPGKEEQGRFIIQELSFHKSITLLSLLSAAGFLLSSASLTVIFFQVRRKMGKDSLPLKYNPVALTSNSDTDTERLATIIMENYTDPGLSVEMLYNRTGISRRRIAALITKKYALSFKQLLNKIRLTEAARLLKETDRNITEIAFILGFSGSSYFFQVFKSAYNISPTDYRKQNSIPGQKA